MNVTAKLKDGLLAFKQIIFAKNKNVPLKSTKWRVHFNGSIPKANNG